MRARCRHGGRLFEWLPKRVEKIAPQRTRTREKGPCQRGGEYREEITTHITANYVLAETADGSPAVEIRTAALPRAVSLERLETLATRSAEAGFP
jgi:hypothetical protein